MTAGGLMPAAFFGHGNPMNALEVNRYTAAWRAFGAAVPRRFPPAQRFIRHAAMLGARVPGCPEAPLRSPGG
jgi:hypothetical protein